MNATLWFVVIGVLLVGMGVSTCLVRRLPLTTALVYLVVGYLLDPAGFSFAALDPIEHPERLERITEVAVLISLFAAGLKLRTPWSDRRWVTPLRLATVSMIVTVGLVTAVGVAFLALPVGAAVLLGAILAPTDPVLASDVQVESAEDRDRLRFALTGEAGMNDGSAFPFVMLGLGLLGLHDLGSNGWRWLAVDVLWAVVGGVGIGWLLGTAVGQLVLWLRRTRNEAVGTDDLLALGLIALAYGVALVAKTYGFLAVFAAGLALRRLEQRHTAATAEAAPAPPVAAAAEAGKADEIGAGPADANEEKSPAYMVDAALGAVEQFDRIGEVVVVLIIGGLYSARFLPPEAWWFVPLLFVVIRPLAVRVGTPMRKAPRIQRRMTMWFGIRGIGSLYYLTYAIAHGLPRPLADRLAAFTLTAVAASIIVHGISVTPLMARYQRYMDARARRLPRPAEQPS